MWIFNRTDASSNPFREAPFVYITQVSYMAQAQSWTPYPHFHTDEYECTLVLRGNGMLNLPGCREPLTAGTIVFIPPGVAHFYQMEAEDPLEHVAIRYRPFPGGSDLEQLSADGQVRLVQTEQPELYRRMFEMMEPLFRSSGGTVDREIQILCLLFLDTARREFSERGRIVPTYTPEYANDILVYLQKNIGRKVTLQELAEHFSLSQSHLSRVFLKTYHISPINYLIYSRMRQAQVYILQDDLPPAEIARRLAYHNTWHFTKAFEQFFHCRPEDYRAFVAQNENRD